MILAGVFAAAISSLDSILAALSQTTVSILYKPEEATSEAQHRLLMRQSKQWVIIWGLILTAATGLMEIARSEGGIPILPLAFGMTAYTMGPLLGMLGWGINWLVDATTGPAEQFQMLAGFVALGGLAGAIVALALAVRSWFK